MSTSATVFTVITTKLNWAQNAGNTGAGVQNPDGSFNITGTVLGTTQTIHAGVELATLGKEGLPKWFPAAGGILSVASIGLAVDNINSAWESGKAIDQADIAALVGGIAGVGGAAIVLSGSTAPIVVVMGAALLTTSVAAGGYQLYAKAKGLTWNAATGSVVEVALNPAQMAQIDEHLQQTLPLWNVTSTLTELGFVTGKKVLTLGSVFSGAATGVADVTSPTGLDTTARNSAALINTTGTYTTQFNSGGGVDDLWVVEKNAGRYAGTREQFRADFVASNDQVDPKTLGVQQGQTYYVPHSSANGDTVYHYSNGATVMNNTTTGEYRMEMPNTDGSGGKTVYSRTADDVGYTVKQVTTNAAGAVVFEHQSYQNTLDADLSPVSTISISGNQTTIRNWLTDTVYQTGTVDAGLNLQGSSLNPGQASYNPSNLSQHTAAEYLLSQGGVLSSSWLNPIGAFYDSQSAVSTNDYTWKQAA